MMNVCTFVGRFRRCFGTVEDGLFILITVYERYTNSKGEKKIEELPVCLKAFSTAATYIEKNAKRGDTIAARCVYCIPDWRNASEDHYFRINEFEIIKD